VRLLNAVSGVLSFYANRLRAGRKPVDANHVIGSETRARQGAQNSQRVANIANALAVAPVQGEQGEVIRLFVVDLVAHFTAFRFQQRSSVVDRDRFIDPSHFKSHVRPDRLGDLDAKTRSEILLET